jgi:hypothetical protein
MTGVPTKLLGRQVLQQVLGLDRTFVLKKWHFLCASQYSGAHHNAGCAEFSGIDPKMVS